MKYVIIHPLFELISPGMNKSIYKVPLIGDIAFHAVYCFLRVTMSAGMHISPYERLRYDKCTIWVPKEYSQIVRSGIDILRTRDEGLFLRLTKKHKLFFLFSEDTTDRTVNIFPLHKRYINWGPEGVATFFVQSVLWKEALPWENPHTINDQKRAALRAAPWKVLEWMLEHSIREDFIEAYREALKGVS